MKNYKISLCSYSLLFLFFNSQSLFSQIVLMTDNSLNGVKTIVCSNGNQSFMDDGTNDGLYFDGQSRTNTIIICPDIPCAQLQVVFTSFDVAPGDTLSVYDGNIVTNPTIPATTASGAGVSNAFGGFVQANCSPSTNPTGCLSFVFTTNGDNQKGTGWESFISCNSTRTQTIVCANGSQSFMDDGTNDGLYFDGQPRTDTTIICPNIPCAQLQIVFTSFDVALGDMLSVYDGNIITNPTIPATTASGAGVSNAFGGFVQANCNPSTNPTGCLSFVFTTNGDNQKGTGWESFISCNSTQTQTIVCANGNQPFMDDGTDDGLYFDGQSRTDTTIICPNIPCTQLQVVFTSFDVAPGDTLSVYDGDIIMNPTIPAMTASGVGVSNAFGGFVQANCSPSINSTGCLSFVFTTNGDNQKGTGWESFISCTNCTPLNCAATNLQVRDNSIPSGTFQAISTLSSSSTITNGATVTFKAGDLILLSPGFQVSSGGIFEAVIEDFQMNLTQNYPLLTNSIIETTTNEQQKTDFKIMPNPTHGVVNFQYELAKAGPVSLAIYSMQGAKIKQLLPQIEKEAGIFQLASIDLGLPKGIYLVSLSTNTGYITKKMILLDK